MHVKSNATLTDWPPSLTHRFAHRRGTARNFNPDAARAGKFCIAEVEEIVEAGELHPDEIHLPGIFVNKVVKATHNEKRIEQLTEIPAEADSTSKPAISGGRGRIVRRAAKEFKDGMYVNLGIGIPTMASNYLPEGVRIELQSENGLMGMGPFPKQGEVSFNFALWRSFIRTCTLLTQPRPYIRSPG
jgi:3-oxoacid CoA-transferase